MTSPEGCIFVRGTPSGSGVHAFVGEFNDTEAVVLEVHVQDGFLALSIGPQEARDLAKGLHSLVDALERSTGLPGSAEAIPEDDLGPVSLPADVSARIFSPQGGGRS